MLQSGECRDKENTDDALAKSLEQTLAIWGLQAEVLAGRVAQQLRHRQWLAIVSSHLGKLARRHSEVCRYLSRSMLDARRDGRAVLVAEGSAIEPLATRAAELFGVPMILVSIGSDRKQTSAHRESSLQIHSHQPIDRDKVVVMLADRVDCVYARSGGNIERALRLRLSGDKGPTVRIAIHDVRSALNQPRIASTLMDQGAIGWYCRPVASDAQQPKPNLANVTTESIKDWTYSDGQWLVHCTRACNGPWPGQSQRQYHDELILGRDTLLGSTERTAINSLERILRLKRLVASALTSCRQTPVVCFSEMPLAELLSRRSYRSHLHRWDYEPYGIAIRKSAAVSMGFQSVIYGEPDERRRLGVSDRYRFQARGRTYDWTREREWRSRKDVVLTDLADSDVRVFVARHDEVQRVQGRYGVFVVGQLIEDTK